MMSRTGENLVEWTPLTSLQILTGYQIAPLTQVAPANPKSYCRGSSLILTRLLPKRVVDGLS